MSIEKASCADCTVSPAKRKCMSDQIGAGPSFCPTEKNVNEVEDALKKYRLSDNKSFYQQSIIQEGSGYENRRHKPYAVKTRIQEIMEFARRMEYRTMGLAFCSGLRKEAASFSDLLEREGFEVISVICKVGCVPKEKVGIQDDDQVSIGKFESTCNPFAQAGIMNEEGTQFNILLGLCVGHDSLFIKESKAPVTILAVKDRVTGHNPLAPLYTIDSYYQRLKKK